MAQPRRDIEKEGQRGRGDGRAGIYIAYISIISSTRQSHGRETWSCTAKCRTGRRAARAGGPESRVYERDGMSRRGVRLIIPRPVGNDLIQAADAKSRKRFAPALHEEMQKTSSKKKAEDGGYRRRPEGGTARGRRDRGRNE